MKYNNPPIAVFGATGRTGGELIKCLSALQVSCLAVTRDLKNARPLPFVNWVQCNMTHTTNIADILQGTKRIYLAMAPSDNFVQVEENVINASKKIGAEHLVLLSAYNASIDSTMTFAKRHAQAEEILKRSGIANTILKPVSFMQNWLERPDFIGTVRKERKIYEALGNTKVSFVDVRDIAESACTILTDPTLFAGRRYILTSSRASTYHHIARALSEAINEKVLYVPLTGAQKRQKLDESHCPENYINHLLSVSDYYRMNVPPVTGSVDEILGRPPRTINEFFNDYAHVFE